MDTSIWRPILYLVGIMAFAGLNAAYLGWCERKGAGRIQRRTGPMEVGIQGLLQPLADGLKLMSKQLLVPQGVDGILFRVAPILAMIPALTSFAVIPFAGNIQARSVELSVLLLFALASIAMMAVLLGGWASGNKYAVISAARSVSHNLAYEVPMLRTLQFISRVVSGIGIFLRWTNQSSCRSPLLFSLSALLLKPTVPLLIWQRPNPSLLPGL